ncbi:MAG TPA: nicotinamide mononucleotide transporter [Micrococcales bacterium]|uniref:nicotinamide riboside transporter PnuC n=1 Tax=Miniimonas arenae TaxID=676201 RepID=UPI000ECCC0F9|nr:nicotinamide riboside transporter PnuC [Miniimonas arenae]HCX85033.1 nicotinamide mononucleotide transporter [Micrococcales bacterium]
MPFTWWEIAGFVSGLTCVLLAARISVWNFPAGILNSALFLVLFARAGLYANAALQVVFLALGVAGWVGWARARRRPAPEGERRAGEAHEARTPDGEVPVRPAPRLAWWVGIPAALAVAVGLVALLRTTDASTQPVWDAATTASSLLAQVFLNRRWTGTWPVWIATDVALVGLYASVGLWLTAVLYVVFTGIAASGWRSWRRAARAGNEPGDAAGAVDPSGGLDENGRRAGVPA